MDSEAVRVFIEHEIRPFIIRDGGDIEFKHVRDGIVTIKFLGACISCPYSLFTLNMGILDRLQEKFPSIKSVVTE